MIFGRLLLIVASAFILSSCESAQVRTENLELLPTAEILNQATLEWQKYPDNEVLASKAAFPLVTAKEFLIRVTSIKQNHWGVTVNGRAGKFVAQFKSKSFSIQCELSDAAAKKLLKDPTLISVGDPLYVKGEGHSISSSYDYMDENSSYEFELKPCSFRVAPKAAQATPKK